MGAWGEDPTSSDDFGDLWDGMESAVAKQIAKIMKPRKPEPFDRWARVGVLIRLSEIDESNLFRVDVDDFLRGVDDTEVLMSDEEWITSWRSPQKLRNELVKANLTLSDHVRAEHRRAGARVSRQGRR